MEANLQNDLNSHLSSTWGARLQMVIYTGTGVSVYRCISSDQSLFICKVLLASQGNYQELEKEAAMLASLKHPGIISQHGYFWLKSSGQDYLVIMLELCEKDLYQDMEMRKRAQLYWSEEELWTHIRTLVGALAFAQSLGVAHRDIKPQNIFITNGQVKIGDWGSSKLIQNPFNTLTGTPVFLSPLQKQALLSHNSSLQHDVYKSDVYSLGLTLLVIAFTEVPVGLLTMQETPEDCANRLTYPDNFKAMLRIMLAQEERDRCDFVTLWSWLSPAPVIEPNPEELHPSPVEVYNQEIQPSLPEDPVSAPAHEEGPPHLSSQPEPLPALLLEEEKKQNEPQPTTCLWKKCGKPITGYKKGVVQLYCDAQHAFCSKLCLNEFLSTSREKDHEVVAKCPKCRSEISPEIIKQIKQEANSGCSGRKECLLQ
jgi:serine/threonine protein kinase